MKKPTNSGLRQVSRREFFKGAGAGLLASESALLARAAPSGAESSVRFVPREGLIPISPHLYMLPDTCNVYVLKDGDRALLVDFGSGHVLNLLGSIGVSKVDALLHTHHHRDQCQGDARAATERIPILVPFQERYLFEDAENFWRNRRVFDLYIVRNDFFTVTHNLPVADTLRDYESYRWGRYEFLIYPTPGHTLGSLSLIGDVDGKKVAFSGDLIHSPGKVVNLYDMQYNYDAPDGVDFTIFSLAKLRELGPQLICPSHGSPFSNPDAGIEELIGKLKAWYKTYAPEWDLTIENRPYAVTPHLIASTQTCSSFYAVVSDSGKALFVDYGSASNNFIDRYVVDSTAVGHRIRIIEHTIPELKARFGLKSVDVAMPSHMHDDHLNGFPGLVRHHGTKIWCYENMVDILENPRGNNLGATLAEPIKVHRSFHHNETFKWEEFEFTVCHSPGHTEFQMALFVDLDGARVAFTGDAFFPARPRAAYQLRHDIVYRNWVENDSHVRSMRTILEKEPTLVAPGHGKPFLSNKADMEDLLRRLEEQQKYFFAVVADPDCNFGLNPSWARLYPYQVLAKAGTGTAVELRVRNYRRQPMQVEAALVLPAGWKASPDVLHLTIQPTEEGREGFLLTVPENWDHTKPRVAIAADLMVDGKYLGQVAEGVVDIQYLS